MFAFWVQFQVDLDQDYKVVRVHSHRSVPNPMFLLSFEADVIFPEQCDQATKSIISHQVFATCTCGPRSDSFSISDYAIALCETLHPQSEPQRMSCVWEPW